MADTSRSRVTITLGRSGQVVKRAGAVVDTDFLDPVPAAGNKRPVRDRLGSSLDAVHDNKRQVGVNGSLSVKANNSVDDTHLSKHDLRFKIMKKTQSNSQQKNVDLRDIFSQKGRSSSTTHKMDQSLLEPRSSSQRSPPQLTSEPRDDRRRMREPKDGQWDPVEIGPRDVRRLMRDPVEVGPPLHKLYDDRQQILDPTDGSMPSRLTSTRTSRTLSQMDLSKTSFSLETLDHVIR